MPHSKHPRQTNVKASLRPFSVIASSPSARKIVNRLLELATKISLRVGLSPVFVAPLIPFGVDAKMKIHLLTRDLTTFVEIFVNHVYDKYCPIREGEVVVDCGAYIGEFALQASRSVGTAGLVLAFEPNPTSFSLCKQNLALNRTSNVRLFPFALGDTVGITQIEVNKTNPGASRLLFNQDAGGRPLVQTRKLPEFLHFAGGRKIRLLKMDVEGSAIQIIIGASSLIEKKCVENVCAEIHRGEEGLQAILETYGFRCHREKEYLYATSSPELSFTSGC